MSTRNWFRTALLALVSASTSLVAQVRIDQDKMLRDTRVSYTVAHADSTEESVVVKYEAFLHRRVWQTGSAAKPLEGKMTDDRRCHYTVRARVYRRAYVVTRMGVHAPVEDYQAVYDANAGGGRGPTSTLESVTRHVTCGDVNLFTTQIANAESRLVAQFDELVALDDDKTRERLRSMLMGSSIRAVDR